MTGGVRFGVGKRGKGGGGRWGESVILISNSILLPPSPPPPPHTHTQREPDSWYPKSGDK